ncbi:hypothetical protein B0H14DRAFT_2690184 [Mycena olivaceomarginata]|nr:hypothetical protein B0H14DRAFT_2690184 [Mycena olivaceomarginata]
MLHISAHACQLSVHAFRLLFACSLSTLKSIRCAVLHLTTHPPDSVDRDNLVTTHFHTHFHRYLLRNESTCSLRHLTKPRCTGALFSRLNSCSGSRCPCTPCLPCASSDTDDQPGAEQKRCKRSPAASRHTRAAATWLPLPPSKSLYNIL